MRNVLKIMGVLIGITNLLFAISFAKTFGGSSLEGYFGTSIQQTSDGGTSLQEPHGHLVQEVMIF